MAIRNAAHGSLSGDTFESNRSGVLVTEGGKLEMENCHFADNGFRQREVVAGSLPITVAGQGSIRRNSMRKAQ